MRRPLRAIEFFTELLKGGGVGVVAIHIAQQPDQLAERFGIKSAVLHDALVCALPKLIEIPPGLGDANDRNVQAPAFHHGLQRRKNLLVGQIARGAEEHEGIGMEIAHCVLLFPAIPSCIAYSLSFRYRRINSFVELSWPSAGSAWLSSSGTMRCASTFPSSTPHWSNELICQMTPCVNTKCS